MNPQRETPLSTSSNNKRTIGTVSLSSAGGGGVAGAITVIVVAILGANDIEIDGVTASAITVVIAYIGGLIGGWLVKPGTGTRRG